MTENRDMWVNCKQCGHEWVGLRLPMEMSKAAKIMTNLHCPNCGADAEHIKVRRVSDGRVHG